MHAPHHQSIVINTPVGVVTCSKCRPRARVGCTRSASGSDPDPAATVEQQVFISQHDNECRLQWLPLIKTRGISGRGVLKVIPAALFASLMCNRCPLLLTSNLLLFRIFRTVEGPLQITCCHLTKHEIAKGSKVDKGFSVSLERRYHCSAARRGKEQRKENMSQRRNTFFNHFTLAASERRQAVSTSADQHNTRLPSERACDKSQAAAS